MSRTFIFSLGMFLLCLLLTNASHPKCAKSDDEVAGAKQLVTQALEAEARGEMARRQQLLEQALVIAPDHAPARWHAGFVQRDGEWLTIEAAQRRAAEDDRMPQYWQLAAGATMDVKDQLRLARWCTEQGLEDLIVAHECFVAGTPVWTETGPKPIERVVTGERVLSQDPETGELAYRFVLQTTLRPSSKTVRIRVANDEIWSTLGHLFWVSGQGWKMAKHLAAGDLIHAVDGPRPVTAVAVGPTTEAHNLVVDGFNTYFVGEFPLLVHDNMPRRLTPTRVPGLNANATHVERVGVEK